MATFKVSWRLCVNDHAVPVESVSLPWMDPFELTSDLDLDEEIAVNLVNLKATGKTTWIEKALNLPARGWLKNMQIVPLILEIQDRIRNRKPKAGSVARLPRNDKHLLPFEIRGKILWFQNTSRTVVLAVKDESLGDLEWFLQELHKDLQNLADEKDDELAIRRMASQPIPEDIQVEVNEGLETIRESSACLSVNWLQSRSCFRITRKSDNVVRHCCVKSLKKGRLEAEEHNNTEILQRMFASVTQEIMEFLSGHAGEVASSSQQHPAPDSESKSPEAGPAKAPEADLAEAPAAAADLDEAPADPAPEGSLDGPGLAPRQPRRKALRGKQAERSSRA